MAQRINRRLSRIENFFSMLLTKGKISDNIFVGELPPTTSKNWDDFVNVDVGQQRDYGVILLAMLTFIFMQDQRELH